MDGDGLCAVFQYIAGGKKAGAKGKVNKPYLVPRFMHSNVSSLSLSIVLLLFFYKFKTDNTSRNWLS